MRHLMQAAIAGVASSVRCARRVPARRRAVRALGREGCRCRRARAARRAGVADLVAALLDARSARPARRTTSWSHRRRPAARRGGPARAPARRLGRGARRRDHVARRRRRRSEDRPRARRCASDGLDPQHRRVLVAGAVLGDFEPALIVEVAEADDAVVSDALAAVCAPGLLETSGGVIGFRHAIIREAVLDATVPHVVDTHAPSRRGGARRRSDDGLSTPTASNAARGICGRRSERRSRRVADRGAARPSRVARAARGGAAAREAMSLARSPRRARRAADALARSLAAQGRWATRSRSTPRRRRSTARHRRATAAWPSARVEVGRPEVAEQIIAAAAPRACSLPSMRITSGRAALVRGDATRALGIARAIAADIGVRPGPAALRARPRRPRARLLGRPRRGEGRVEAPSREALPPGARKRSSAPSCSSARSSCSRASRPTACTKPSSSRARRRARRARLGRGEPGDRAGDAGRPPGRRGAPRRSHRDVPRASARPARLPARRAGATSSFATTVGRGAARRGRGAVDTPTFGCTPRASGRTSRCAPAGMTTRSRGSTSPRDHADDAAASCRATRRAGWCGRSPPPADRRRAPWPSTRREQMPDLARWHGRPVVLARGAALLAGDEDGIDGAIAAAPGACRSTSRSCACSAPTIIRGPARVRWLREALDIYEAAGAATRGRPRAAGAARRGRPVSRAAGEPSCLSPTSSRRRASPRAKPKCCSCSATACRTPRSRTAVPLGAHGRDARVVVARQARRTEPGSARRRSRPDLRLGLVVSRM